MFCSFASTEAVSWASDPSVETNAVLTQTDTFYLIKSVWLPIHAMDITVKTRWTHSFFLSPAPSLNLFFSRPPLSFSVHPHLSVPLLFKEVVIQGDQIWRACLCAGPEGHEVQGEVHTTPTHHFRLLRPGKEGANTWISLSKEMLSHRFRESPYITPDHNWGSCGKACRDYRNGAIWTSHPY